MRKANTILILATMTTAVLLADGHQTQAVTHNPFVTPEGWAGLLQDAAVQEDLKLSDEQIAKIQTIIGKLPNKPDEVEAEVRKFVMGDQLARLKQLDWRREGGYALFDAEVSESLAIDEQQAKQLAEAAELNAVEHKKMRDFMARARFRSREAMRQYVEGYRQPANERLFNVLKKVQHAKLKTLLGEPLAK